MAALLPIRRTKSADCNQFISRLTSTKLSCFPSAFAIAAEIIPAIRLNRESMSSTSEAISKCFQILRQPVCFNHLPSRRRRRFVCNCKFYLFSAAAFRNPTAFPFASSLSFQGELHTIYLSLNAFPLRSIPSIRIWIAAFTCAPSAPSLCLQLRAKKWQQLLQMTNLRSTTRSITESISKCSHFRWPPGCLSLLRFGRRREREGERALATDARRRTPEENDNK